MKNRLISQFINIAQMKAGITNSKLAKKMKCSPQYWGMVRKGKVSFPLGKRARIAKLLKIDISEINRCLVRDFQERLEE